MTLSSWPYSTLPQHVSLASNVPLDAEERSPGLRLQLQGLQERGQGLLPASAPGMKVNNHTGIFLNFLLVLADGSRLAQGIVGAQNGRGAVRG